MRRPAVELEDLGVKGRLGWIEVWGRDWAESGVPVPRSVPVPCFQRELGLGRLLFARWGVACANWVEVDGELRPASVYWDVPDDEEVPATPRAAVLA
jgi:hypothetical protein